MNRMGLGLAVGAGYVLGRTKKMKAAAPEAFVCREGKEEARGTGRDRRESP